MRSFPTIELAGETYVTEATAASLIKRSVKTISRYITVGNSRAQLPALNIDGKRLIKLTDLKKHPVTGYGSRARFNVMHLSDAYTLIRCPICSEGGTCDA